MALGAALDAAEANAAVSKLQLVQVRTAMKKLRIVMLRFGTARQEMVLERWTNPKPLSTIVDRAAI
jgi:Spy/CpxP family protein refolding chaperone